MKLTKKKRLEKAKIKLKAKKLPKGQNVTDTSFKVRKIVLPSQLKDPKLGDVPKNQLSIKEIISRLDHHRPQIRLFGLEALKGIVLSQDLAELALDLPKIIDAIASKILDLYSNIRNAALNILKVLLTKIPEGMLDPHFLTIKVYMVAAMTHINPFVQRDSLRMLDMMLDGAPQLMKSCADTFLPTFLDLVSNIKNNKDTERTLTDIYNKKISNVKWREMVLSRLTKYFSILISERRDETTSVYAVKTQLTSKTSSVIHWNGDTELYVAEHLSFIQGICYLSKLFGSSSYSITETKSDEELLKTHVDSVVPILLDSWAEASPKAKNQKGLIHGQQAAITLQFILETLVRLWKCLEDIEDLTGKLHSLTMWFKLKYGQKIMKKIVSNFPYTTDDVLHYKDGEQLKGSEAMLTEIMLPLTKSCVEQNLLICYLVECLDCFSDGDITDRVLQCLNNCMRNWESKKSLPTLKKVLKSLLTSKNQGWPKGEILKTIMESFKVKSLEEEMKLILLDFVCDYIHLYSSLGQDRIKALEKWISELPLLLLQPAISMQVVLALRRLSSQNWELFTLNIKKNRRSIADNLFLIKITGAVSHVEGQKAIIEILFHSADAHIFRVLQKLVIQNGGNEELMEFISNMEEFHLYARSFFKVWK